MGVSATASDPEHASFSRVSAFSASRSNPAAPTTKPAFGADTGAIASSGIVTVQEYGSSSAPSARSVCAPTAGFVDLWSRLGSESALEELAVRFPARTTRVRSGCPDHLDGGVFVVGADDSEGLAINEEGLIQLGKVET